MSALGVPIIHVVAADVSMGKRAVLHTLCGQHNATLHQRVVHVGRRGPASATPRLDAPAFVHAPLALKWFRTRALRRALGGLGDGPAGIGPILHVWSPTALGWCLPLAGQVRGLLVETEPGDNLNCLARYVRQNAGRMPIALVCPTARAHQRLLRLGVSPEACWLIRESVDAGELDRARAADLRPRLDLRPDHTVVVALPPASRATGTFFAAWATLLLEKAHPTVRLVIPADGCERERVRRLVSACRHEHVVRFASPGTAPAELAAVADLAVYLPRGDAPVTGLLWAMAAGRPIVASDVPGVTEFLTDGTDGWLCRPEAPQEAAGRMLQVLARPEEAQRLAAAARVRVLSLGSRTDMLAQYAAAYASLVGA